VINFLCVIGQFSILGYTSPLFDIPPASNACVQTLNIMPQNGDSFVRCTSFLNVVTIGYLFIAVLQPFAFAFSYAAFSEDDIPRRRPAAQGTQLKPMQGSSLPASNPSANQYGQGPVPPAVLVAQQQQQQQQQQNMMLAPSSPRGMMRTTTAPVGGSFQPGGGSPFMASHHGHHANPSDWPQL